MGFHCLDFFVFLPIVLMLYHWVPAAWRWTVMLGASYAFYMSWVPWFAWLLAGSTLVDFAAARFIARAQARGGRVKRVWLAVSLTFNLGLLMYFKYLGFFVDVVTGWTGASFDFERALLLPIGISFYTFQTLSYTIDVFRGRLQPERHLGRFATYIAFFPQLLAGPIERARDLLPQMAFAKPILLDDLILGARRIMWGTFKKLVVADRLALFVDQAFKSPEAAPTWFLWMGAFFFLFQLYCDFSGYSDIAVGVARMFGIRLSENFAHRVYWVKSFRRFWEDWHRTMTYWFRDYVFYPLSSLSRSTTWILSASLLTMTINGFWHGASWTFLLWGLLNGAFLVGETLLDRKLPAFLKSDFIAFITSMSLVLFSIILFRSPDLERAWTYTVNMFDVRPSGLPFKWLTQMREMELGVALGALVVMDLVHIWLKDQTFESALNRLSPSVRFGVYAVCVSTILWLGMPVRSEFIYFDF